ncbi:hypothetical protein CBR_g3220 [Chara braunii]|uniref:carbonic anhydrase n=1 Tax=Chara braunii TaxID=69332 RepID=A0A388KF52_CHABU|nr:hypothetical protein CBR_g3220 [Chara braunii]|eukprot:GBG68679.1 hypothetical protein CBR_g3220 [Chara braunii]
MEDSRAYRVLVNAAAAAAAAAPNRVQVPFGGGSTGRPVRDSYAGACPSGISFILVLIVAALLTTSPLPLVASSPGLRDHWSLSRRLLSESTSGDAAASQHSVAQPAAQPVAHSEDPPYAYSVHGGDWGGVCSEPKSRFQSPVDIVLKDVVNVPALGDLRQRGHYPQVQANVSVYHNNHTFEISFHEDNRIRLPMFDVDKPYNLSDSWDASSYAPNGGSRSKPRAETFHLTQCHLHCLSETEIDGSHFDVEIHCVHVRHGGGEERESVGVWAVFMNRTTGGADCDPYLEKLLAAVPELLHRGPHDLFPVQLPGFSLSHLLPSDGTYFHYYPGSLTTPPCSEGLLWYVFKNPLPICDRHFETISDLVQALNGRKVQNFRQVQPLHGRVMYRWMDPKPDTEA